MARPKRMGAYNALDDLLPGPAWGSPGDQGPAWDLSAEPAAEPAPPPRRPRLQPVPDPPRSRGDRGNALDELLPGPGPATGSTTCSPGPRPRRAGGSARHRGPGATAAARHLEVWNPLDGPPAAPEPTPPVPAKARMSFRLPADLVETARDAVAHLAGSADRTTLTALTERALRVELARLAITHNHGQPFPPRDP